MRRPTWLLLSTALLAPTLAPCAERADRQAELERLLALLPGGPATLAAGELQLTLTPGAPRPAQAGLALRSEDLEIRGRPAAVLSHLRLRARAGQALGPPLELTRQSSELRARVRIFTLPPIRRFDPDAPEAELERLREALVWLERRSSQARRLTALLGALLDSEGVQLEGLTLRRGRLEARGLALDGAARDLFARDLTRRLQGLERPPLLDLSGVGVHVPEPPPPGTVLGLRRAPLLPVLAWLAPLDGLQYVALEEVPPRRLSLDLGTRAPGAWLPDVLRAANLHPARTADALLLPAPPETAAWPDAGHPLDLSIPVSPAGDLLRELLDRPGQALVLGVERHRRLGVLLRARSADLASALVLSSLGLEVRRGSGVCQLRAPGLPSGRESSLPDSMAPGPVSLLAVDAPAAALLAGLLGRPGLHACPPLEDLLPQSFSAQDVDGPRLARALLDALERRLEGERLLPLQAGVGAPAPVCVPPDPSLAEDPETRLLAVLDRVGGVRQALVAEAGTLRWLARGARLSDGRVVQAVRPRLLELSSPGGPPERLGPRPSSHSSRVAPPGEAPARIPLSQLRLAGTFTPPGAPPEALLLGPDDEPLRVRPGDPLGRRCGQVQRIDPGALRVRLRCPQADEPTELALSF